MPGTYVSYFFANIRSKPYALLGFAGFVTGLRSFIPAPSDMMDINMHDTYFVIAGLSFYKFFAAILLFLWSFYLFSDRLMLSRRLTLFHVLATLIPLIFFAMIRNPDPSWGLDGIPRRYYAINPVTEHRPFFSAIRIYVTVVLILFIGQVIFIINLIGGAIRYFRRSG